MRYNPSGFTIIELLIYMAIVSVLLVVMTQILTSVLDIRVESGSDTVVDENTTFIFTRLQYDIHRASGIITPAAPGQSGSTMKLNIGGVTYTYALVGSQLQITSDLGTDMLSDSASSVSTFTVTRIGDGTSEDTLRINLSLSSVANTSGGVHQNRQLQTSVSIR